ncbi:MAG: hypothetical protein WCV90_09015 [Candidatus Woesearchaeota archaeon]|jgi:hypothetical protein
MEKNRIIKAILVGAALGLLTEFIVRPYIEKPLEKKVNEVV